MSSRPTLWLLAIACLMAGCDPQTTRIGIRIPTPARPVITRVEIRAYPLGDLCQSLRGWATGTCGQSCDAASPAPLPAASDATGSVELLIAPDGTLEGPGLALGREDTWEVLVIGYANDALIYGCSNVQAGEAITIELWYPWCAAEEACSRQFRRGCNARPDCAETLTDPLSPICSAAGTTAPAWVDASGRDCEAEQPIDGAGRCQIGVVNCTPGDLFDVAVPAICPEPGVEPCADGTRAYDPGVDFDCNLAHPACSVETCETPYEMRACGNEGCGLQYCSVRGVWSDCAFGEEVCNGLDDDCNGAEDDAPLEDLLRSCNFGADASGPVADNCVAGECVCGSGPPCGVGKSCCPRLGCRNLSADPAACGACDNPCTGAQRCVDGRCVMDVSDAGTAPLDGGLAPVPDCRSLADCNPDPPGLPRANTCTGDGRCVCSDSPACEGIELCCGGACVNARTSLAHCGGCDQPCPGVCRGGTCQR